MAMTQLPRLILTPTARLARAEARRYALQQAEAGHSAWLAPRILSFPAWLSALMDAYFLESADIRVAISAAQAKVLWQALIDREVFIGEPQVAALALRSWRLLHEYKLPAPPHWDRLLLSEDNRKFQSWAAAYEQRCRDDGLIDEWAFAAELPAHIQAGDIAIPDTIELRGFDLPATPLQHDILQAVAALGTKLVQPSEIKSAAGLGALQQFSTADAELGGAARWARARIASNPNARLAVVVPDLGARLAAVERIFRECFDAAAAHLFPANNQAWHISLGLPLMQWPLVTDALMILALPRHRLTQPQSQRLLRSPFLSDWDSEGSLRNQTLAWLRLRAPFDLTTNEFIHALQSNGAEKLAGRLQGWLAVREEHETPAWPSQWTQRLQLELTSLGYAQGRALNSNEYQVLQRWHQLFEEFAKLDLVCDQPLSRRRAVAVLSERSAEAIFREQNTGVPVEVVGVEEALGSDFDGIWLTTLNSEVWPGPLQRDPLIPSTLQLPIPRATSEGRLARAKAELSGLLRCADEVCASFAIGSEEIAIEPTALLGDVEIAVVPTSARLEAAPLVAAIDNAAAPVYPHSSVAGGTGVLRNQSDCPFRAYAQRRLGAVDLSAPRPGLSAGQRGNVVHWALEAFWADVHSAAELRDLEPAVQQAKVSAAVQVALATLTRQFRLTLSSASRLLEQHRTERVVQRWLQLEKQRGDFTVAAREQTVRLAFAGLQLSGTVDRLDRLANGTTLLIDYKTGRANKADWYPDPRLVDPQLPAYAVSLEPAPAAIAFARLRPEDLKFEGISDTDANTPGITDLASTPHRYRDLSSWPELLSLWQQQLEGLAEQFMQGHAPVDPRAPVVCQRCHLQSLCRVSERAPHRDLDEDEQIKRD